MLRIARIMSILLLGVGTTLYSQQLSHQVIVPLAGVISGKSVNYSQTVGETAVEIINCSSYTFTQGFQQPGIHHLTDVQPGGNGVDVYPNPVINDLKVKLFGNIPRDFVVEVITITGTIVISERISFTDEYNYEAAIPMGSLTKGLYFIRIWSTDKIINRTFKIEKL
jgi:hypothetical protein